MSRRHPIREPSVTMADLDRAGLLSHVRRTVTEAGAATEADLLGAMTWEPAFCHLRRALWYMLSSHTLPKLPRYTYAELARMWGGYAGTVRDGIIQHCKRHGLPLPPIILGTSRTNDAFFDVASVSSAPAAMRPGRLRMVPKAEQRKATCQRYGACLDAFVRTYKGGNGFCAPNCVGYAPYEVRATAFLTQREGGSVPSAAMRVYGAAR